VLAAREAAAALAEGFAQVGVECVQVPLADGGEGTLDAFEAAYGGERRSATVSDPLGRPVEAEWLLLTVGRAVIESAQAIGLALVAPAERDPLHASSRGVGELIAAAHANELVIGLGDTATVDGGAGLSEVLLDLLAPTTVLCDVRNPLLDAARVFARQKGASDEEVHELERRLDDMEELSAVADLPGAGAAGGLGAALAALGAKLVPGADYVIEAVGLRERIGAADFVVTGEGTVDRTSLEGKVTGAVVRLCREQRVRCAVFGGRIEEHLPGAEMHELSGDSSRARGDLVALGARLGRAA
jgi:glycerate 2-kinase